MKLLFIIILIAVIGLPIAVPIWIISLIVRLVKKRRNMKESVVYLEQPKPVRKFTGSEIMFIIGTVFIILSGIAFGCAGWVNTSPTGRVLIMLAATAVMFGAGVLFRKVVKLNGTATAFSIIGTVLLAVTVITSGYYELFGEWLSTSGDGQYMLFALSTVLIAVSSFIEGKFFGNNAFKYLSCMSVTATLIFLAGQIADDYSTFAVIMTLMQTAVTVWFVFGDIKSDIIKTSAKLSAVIFSVLAFVWVTDRILVPDGGIYFIMLLTLAQLVGYGIYLKNPTLKGLQSVLSILTAFTFAADVQENDDNAIMLFAGISLIIYVLNRFVPCLKNKFSEVFTLGFAVIGCIYSITVYEVTAFIVPVIMSGLIMSYAFAEKKSVQVLAGLCSPIMPIALTIELNSLICDGEELYNVLVIVLSAVTAAIVYLPKYAFNLYARFPRKTDTILYTNMLASGIILLLLCDSLPEGAVIMALACVVHFIVSDRLKNNFTAIASSISMIYVIYASVEDYSGNDRNFFLYSMFGLFIILMTASRIFFRKSVITRKEDKTRIDAITLSAWILIIGMDFGKTGDFLKMISIAVYIANFIRKKTRQGTASVLLSASAVMTAYACINRPFLIVESEMVSSKITLAIIALMGVAYKYIWKNNPTVSKRLSDMIFIVSFAGLILDVMDYHRLGNTIFGLAVTAVILIISFGTKSRTWFGASSVALVTITVWASVRYFGKLDWWVYLFIAGIIFIAVASVNEYCKSRNTDIKSKLSEVFSDWK